MASGSNQSHSLMEPSKKPLSNRICSASGLVSTWGSWGGWPAQKERGTSEHHHPLLLPLCIPSIELFLSCIHHNKTVAICQASSQVLWAILANCRIQEWGPEKPPADSWSVRKSWVGMDLQLGFSSWGQSCGSEPLSLNLGCDTNSGYVTSEFNGIIRPSAGVGRFGEPVVCLEDPHIFGVTCDREEMSSRTLAWEFLMTSNLLTCHDGNKVFYFVFKFFHNVFRFPEYLTFFFSYHLAMDF